MRGKNLLLKRQIAENKDKTIEDLKFKLRAIERKTVVIAHDARNFLSGIISINNLIIEDPSEFSKIMPVFSSFAEQAKFLLDLVTMTLSNGNFKVEKEKFDLAKLIQTLYRYHRSIRPEIT
ncbi:MAG TPA: hypothetical protein PKN62_02475, partial [bacterium]|nr:hypothetical protein [bacterium]